MRTEKEIEELVKQVLEREKREGLSYPNLLGGREIDRMFGRPLNIEEWTTFHEIAKKEGRR